MGGLHLTTHQHELINPTSFISLVKNNKSTITNYLVIKMLMALTSLGLTSSMAIIFATKKIVPLVGLNIFSWFIRF